MWITFGLVELLLERNWVVDEELRSIFENFWDSVLGDVQRAVRLGIGEHEGNVLSQGPREESGESGECVVHADSDTRDGAIC